MFFRKKDYQVPEEYRDMCLSEQNAFNMRHLTSVTLIMMPLILLLLIQHTFFPEVKYEGFELAYRNIYILILCEGILFLIILRFLKIDISESVRKILVLFYLYILSFLLMGLTFYDLHFGQELSAYIIVLMFLYNGPVKLDNTFSLVV